MLTISKMGVSSVGLFRIFILICFWIGITTPCQGAMTAQDSPGAIIANKLKILFSQPDSPAKVDSLESIMEKDIWHFNNDVSAETVKYYLETGLALAEKYKKYAAQSRFLDKLSYQYARLGQYQEALRIAQEGLRRAQKNDLVREQFKILMRLTDAYNDLNQKDASLNCTRAIQRLFRTRYRALDHTDDDIELICGFMRRIVGNYAKHGQKSELLDSLQGWEAWIKKNPDPIVRFYTYRCYRTLSIDNYHLFTDKGDVITNYLKGLRLLEDVVRCHPAHHRFLHAEFFYAASFFHQYNLFDLSLQYYRKARDHFRLTIENLEKSTKSNRQYSYFDLENLAQTYANMSPIYAALGMPDSGHYCLKEALRYRTKNKDTRSMIDSYLMLSRSAIELQKPQEAFDYIRKGDRLIKNYEKDGKQRYDYINTVYKAMVYEQLSQTDSLKRYYFLSKMKWQEMPKTSIDPNDFFKLKYKILYLTFFVRNALRFRDYDLIVSWNDSLNKCQDYYARLNQDIRAKESLIKYDVAGKEKLIAALNREKALEKERDAQQRRFILALSIGLAATLGLGIIIYRQSLLRQKANRILSLQKNQIQLQKAELENAYEEINTTLEQVQHQKEEIARKNEKIEDSIRYAYQIQTAILPDPAAIQTALPKHFIFYRPKDIVSGDFYWLSERDDRTFFCVADCTGHGVPGAFMSVVGSNALHHAVIELGLNDPDTILYTLDQRIRSALRQERHSESKDGMDIGLCVWHRPTNRLRFAGAGRPLYHFSNGQLIEIKGDKFPIGGGQYEEKQFKANEISLNTGDRLYLFSDGITDQFGGSAKKKFTPKRLQEFILAEASHSLSRQSQLFHQTMTDWINGCAQLDDLTLLAVEV